MVPLSRDEFVALFLEAHPRLWTVAVAVLGDRDLAEDIVQDSAITGLDRLDSYERGTNFQAWMSQIVRFKALNCLKACRRRNIEQESGHLVESAAAFSPENPIAVESASETGAGAFDPDRLGLDDQLAAAVAGLAPERRICLMLRVVQAMPYEEIAEMLGIPASTAMSHVHRAKASLKHQLFAEPDAGGDLR